MSDKVRFIFITLAVVVLTGFLPVAPTAQACTTISSCTQEQQILKQQQQQAKQNFEKNKKEAQNLQGVIADLQADISFTEGQIGNAEDQIRVTTEILNQLNTNILETERKLSSAYISLYELSRTSSTQLVWQRSLNDALSQAQYIQSIQSQLQKEVEELERNQQDRISQKAHLEAQRTELENERIGLDSKRSRQSYLFNIAQSNASYYAGMSEEIQKKIAVIERQINTLIARQSWGSDIISANQGSWYYRQLDYPNTFLGNSPYTVAQYGCLITSIAMVSTYYGRTVTPPQIAGYPGNFDNQGYLLRQPPLPTSFSSMTTSSVNWATVNNELDAGRPVIISIYIAAVGQINADGSSHFVVLHGRSNGKYFMHDPLGAGRSYAARDVRSMKLIRN